MHRRTSPLLQHLQQHLQQLMPPRRLSAAAFTLRYIYTSSLHHHPRTQGRNRTSCSSCSSSSSTSTSTTIPPPIPLHTLTHLQQELNHFNSTLPVESAHTPPSSWFTDPIFHQLELATIFTSHPLAVGSPLQIPHAGDYFCGNLCNIHTHPFIVLRDTDHKIRAFYNVCRHKGMRVVAGEKGHLSKAKLACPYHGWEYRLDGRLSKATRIGGIKNFNVKEMGLVEIPVRVWGPLIFLEVGDNSHKKIKEEQAEGGVREKTTSTHTHGNKGVDPLGHLAPLCERFDADFGGFFTKGLRHVHRRSYVLQCNWKVVADNYLDGGYHVPFAHKALGSNLDLSSYTSTIHEGYSLQACAAGDGASTRVGKAALYAYVYPNLMINRYGPWCDTNVVFPRGERECEVIFDYFLEEEFIQNDLLDDSGEEGEEGTSITHRHTHKHTSTTSNQNEEELTHTSKATLSSFIHTSLIASDKVQEEDTYLCENVQIGLESGGYDRGRYAPQVEALDHDFHLWLAKELKGGLQRMEEKNTQR